MVQGSEVQKSAKGDGDGGGCFGERMRIIHRRIRSDEGG